MTKQVKIFWGEKTCNQWLEDTNKEILQIQVSCATNINTQPQECIMVVYEND